MRNLLFILLFVPLTLFSQETKIKKIFNYDSIKYYLKITDDTTYFNGEPLSGVVLKRIKDNLSHYIINYKNGKYDGLLLHYYENGQLKEKGNYKNGKKEGLFEHYYENGQLDWIKNYKNGKREGLFEHYYENGQLKSKYYFKNDKSEGLLEFYYENGQLKGKYSCKNGKMEGLFESYYEDGTTKEKGNYKNGEKEGLFEHYYEDGQLASITNFKNGYGKVVSIWYYEDNKVEKWDSDNDELTPYEGLFEFNYENGQLKEKGNYKNGKKEGLFEHYYENGQLLSKHIYKNGKLNGAAAVVHFNKNGGFPSVRQYKDGELFGMLFNYGYKGNLITKKRFNGKSFSGTDLRHFINDKNIYKTNVYDLEAMIKLFLEDCKENNIKLLSDYKITAKFEELEKNTLALAFGIFNDEEIILKVDPIEWSKASNPKKWYILYHELGHDVLNLEHGQGGKMMFNFTDNDYTWDDFFEDKSYMLHNLKPDKYFKFSEIEIIYPTFIQFKTQ
jgi:antitoxin component YwqK of YwqJK toxin-antitoxin module